MWFDFELFLGVWQAASFIQSIYSDWNPPTITTTPCIKCQKLKSRTDEELKEVKDQIAQEKVFAFLCLFSYLVN